MPCCWIRDLSLLCCECLPNLPPLLPHFTPWYSRATCCRCAVTDWQVRVRSSPATINLAAVWPVAVLWLFCIWQSHVYMVGTNKRDFLMRHHPWISNPLHAECERKTVWCVWVYVRETQIVCLCEKLCVCVWEREKEREREREWERVNRYEVCYVSLNWIFFTDYTDDGTGTNYAKLEGLLIRHKRHYQIKSI